MNRRDKEGTNSEAASYDLVAHEYYDPIAHPTCFNFNRLSRLYIDSRFSEPWNGQPVIEVGAGDSAVAALLHARGYSLTGLRITDASAAMLAHSQRWTALGAVASVCVADQLGGESGSYEYLVSSLGDPYNTPGFWIEAHRVLRRGGRAVFTTPSFEWGERFREGSAAHRAEFLVDGGHRLDLPSFVVPLAAQVEMMQAAGFSVVHFESLGAGLLHPSEPLSPKLDLFDADHSSIIWGFELVSRDVTSDQCRNLL